MGIHKEAIKLLSNRTLRTVIAPCEERVKEAQIKDFQLL